MVNIIFGCLLSYKAYRLLKPKTPVDVSRYAYWKDKVSEYERLNLKQSGNIFFAGDSLVDRFNLAEFLQGKIF